MANINGTSQDDVLRGTTAADVIWARSGNDQISGLAGHDRLYGEAGNDTIYGGDGNDRIGGGLGNDQLFGHGGDDTLFGDAGRDYLWGDAGNDELNGGADNDVLRGNSGNDILRGDGGDDLLDGGDGNDLIYGGSGADTFIGGDGIDTVSFFFQEYGVFVHMAGHYAANGDPEMVDPTIEERLEGVERVRGSSYDDLLFAQIEDGLPIQWTEPLAFFGLGGNDRIVGGSAGDELEGNDGDDVINGDDGNDVLRGNSGNDTLRGDGGNDLMYGGNGADTFIGGDGIDTVSYVDEQQGVFVHLASAYVPGSHPELEDHLTYEFLTSVERVRGSAHDDALFGVMNASEEELNTPIALFGLGGNDSITGGFADDELEGNDGNDFLNGHAGSDLIDGGAGVDFLQGGAGVGNDRLTGGSDEDSFVYRVDHRIDGSGTTGADVITDFHAGEDVLRWSAFVEADPNNGQPIAGVSYAAELFGELDTNSDGRISGLDTFSDSSVVEGERSLVVDFSAFLNAELAAGHDLKGTLSGDTLTLLGVTSLRTQDIDVV
jgi:Ca2+-binding RTX toxin-like protein